MLFQPPTAMLPGAAPTTAAECESGWDDLPPALRTATDAPVTAARRPLSRLFSVPAWPAPVAAAACVALLAGIAFGDWATGTAIRVTPLYFLPIILASLRFHAPGALLVAAASTLLAIWPSPEAAQRAGEPWVLATNGITEALGFTFVALVTGVLQRQGERLRRQRRALEMIQRELQADMSAAELLQGHLLRRPLPELPGLELAAEIVFARGVGGDFYDLRRAGEQLAICVADVSGKGAQAALISAALRGFLDEAAGSPTDPQAFLQHLNERLFDALPEEMFVTMFYGRLDLTSGALCYASAGHDPPLLCRGERVEELPPTGPALGLGLELPLCSGRAVLQPGEMLLLYTDGLTTARHPRGGRIGEERVAAWLQERAALPPAALVEELLHLAGAAGNPPIAWVPGAATQGGLEDDVAVIALRRRTAEVALPAPLPGARRPA